MLSSFQQLVGNQYSSRDQLGILLALVIGTGGLIFVFFLPDLILGLARQIPMLSPQDWPGIYVGQELSIREPELLWQEERKFFQNLGLNNEVHTYASISQEAVWYADPMKAAASWHQLTSDYETTYSEQAIVVSFTSNANNDKPESKLFCRSKELLNADDQHICAYFANWEHWFTQVMFYFEEFQPFELQQITGRVDQLLMSALAEPCYWIFCTNQQENKDR